MGRRVGGEVPAKRRGVSEGRAAGDKAGGRWCLVRGPPSLDFLPLTPQAGAASLGSIRCAGRTRWEAARRARGGNGNGKQPGFVVWGGGEYRELIFSVPPETLRTLS